MYIHVFRDALLEVGATKKLLLKVLSIGVGYLPCTLEFTCMYDKFCDLEVCINKKWGTICGS